MTPLRDARLHPLRRTDTRLRARRPPRPTPEPSARQRPRRRDCGGGRLHTRCGRHPRRCRGRQRHRHRWQRALLLLAASYGHARARRRRAYHRRPGSTAAAPRDSGRGSRRAAGAGAAAQLAPRGGALGGRVRAGHGGDHRVRGGRRHNGVQHHDRPRRCGHQPGGRTQPRDLDGRRPGAGPLADQPCQRCTDHTPTTSPTPSITATVTPTEPPESSPSPTETSSPTTSPSGATTAPPT